MLCTHGRFGEELIRSAEMITGPLKNVQAFSLMPGMDPPTRVMKERSRSVCSE